MEKMQISISGTRGIPAQHGGFETFAEQFSLYLQQRGWRVTVYCQGQGEGDIYEDEWHGIHRVNIPVPYDGAMSTIVFDWKCTLHAAKLRSPVLVLGYNTALFCIIYRLRGIPIVINMDGIEWKREKWSVLERTWLYVNEKLGAWLGSHLVADHPEIKKHLSHFVASSKVTVIPYSADFLETANDIKLAPFNLGKNNFIILIARPEPENSILEIVKAYSSEKRQMPLVVLGNYIPESNRYHKTVLEAASDEVQFVGAIYDKDIVHALRFYSFFYIHGHTVGGTNPSLVEALGAGCPILAHKNKFNQWVAGEGAVYFSNEEDCARQITNLIKDTSRITSMRLASVRRFKERFTWDKVYQAYSELLLDHLY